jgi:predicted ATP-dependent serine protease
MIEIKGGVKEQIVRQWFNDQHGGLVPKEKVLDLFSEFEASEPIESISYGLFNGVMKKIKAEGHASSQSAAVTAAAVEGHSVDEPMVIKVEDMEFPDFKLHKSGKWIDRLFSDHEEGGGLYGGTVNIVIGESGVGKSTVMLDLLATMKVQNPDAKLLYISSEMTRNDIMFYYRKTPAIGQVPTLLLMDYVKTGNLAQVLEKTLNGDYDIILLDSYQDVLVKLKEVHNWRSTYAESWLTNAMIDAAEKQGCSVLAIQHMTKGGTYVGSTYLKHATTAMLEIRFDLAGNRYLEFSKNRRGGSGTGKRLYYSLNDAGDVVYDVERFTETEDMRQLESNETIRQSELSRQFEEIFLKKKPEAEEQAADHSVVEAEVELVEANIEDLEEGEEN